MAIFKALKTNKEGEDHLMIKESTMLDFEINEEARGSTLKKKHLSLIGEDLKESLVSNKN
jgi:hypothetical protein